MAYQGLSGMAGATPPPGAIPSHSANFEGMTPIQLSNGKTAYFVNPQGMQGGSANGVIIGGPMGSTPQMGMQQPYNMMGQQMGWDGTGGMMQGMNGMGNNNSTGRYWQ